MKNLKFVFAILLLALVGFACTPSQEQHSIKVEATEYPSVKSQIENELEVSIDTVQSETILEQEAKNEHSEKPSGIMFLFFAMAVGGFSFWDVFKFRQYFWVIELLFKMFKGIDLKNKPLKQLGNKFVEIFGEVNLTDENIQKTVEVLPLAKKAGGIDSIHEIYTSMESEGMLEQLPDLKEKVESLGGWKALYEMSTAMVEANDSEKKKNQ
ncbi:hypothetical protein V9L05_18775 [Bernardetia sp. Wsw4-3y2]|uniref:hypothetical protein n=1 Tax=Bernardetia sp. Wsw4-3y2 TaxID=3127471 RepID=UPI0030CFC256